MNAKFTTKQDTLFIDGRRVLKGWESFTGWYWFGVEKVEKRTPGKGQGGSVINGQEVEDTIWYGYVQGHSSEWGYFSQAELESVGPYKVWQIPSNHLVFSGRRTQEVE